ncbi:LOG family protein [Nocardioides stalactiti]|uniref:LOG family protein n=1 Tax=Nocardioides stalactiti TaxID=2755356 RepID=UPI0028A6506F|nr:TIGR00730 family Rossman fold protein [Nocardioides stalactiti]
MIQRLAIFLGSRDGDDPRFGRDAYDVGAELAARGIELVYGGGGGGLMGRVSQGVLDGGGRVYGVIPRFMVEREWGRLHEPGVQMHVVETMHERKAMMTARADAFLVLPGGLGTLEELFEVWTWQTLSLHSKPVGLLNTDGFWDPLVATLDRLADHEFMSRTTVDDLVVAPDLAAALDGLASRLG